MDTHLLLEAIIAATSVIGLSSSLAGLWMAKKAAGKAVREVKGVTEEPVGKATATVGKMAGRVKKAGQSAYDGDWDDQGDEEDTENDHDDQDSEDAGAEDAYDDDGGDQDAEDAEDADDDEEDAENAYDDQGDEDTADAYDSDGDNEGGEDEYRGRSRRAIRSVAPTKRTPAKKQTASRPARAGGGRQ